MLKKYQQYIYDDIAVIPDGVRIVSDEAFAHCKEITSIRLPKSLTSIGQEAFMDCPNITSIKIPEGVTSIGSNAFRGCTRLTRIRIPNSVTRIDMGAFCNCQSLLSIEIPYGVTMIMDNTFSDCINLSKVEIPNSVTMIGECAFRNCHSLTHIEIPDGMSLISNYAFINCYHLKQIHIPDSVRRIGYFAFAGCIDLEEMVVASGNREYCSKSNCILSKDESQLIAGCKTSVIPNGVTEICTGAFKGDGFLAYSIHEGFPIKSSISRGLESITIPESVTVIGYDAFRDCIGLTSLIIPSSISEIKARAFMGCYRIRALSVCVKNPEDAEYLLRDCGLAFSAITLNVPIGMGYAYRHQDFFKQFKKIVATVNNPTMEKPIRKRTDKASQTLVKISETHKPVRIKETNQHEPHINPIFERIKYVFFDTETTGLPKDYKAPSSALDNWPRMIQLSWITTDKDGTIIAENDHIIYPAGFVIPSSASKVNGISMEVAKQKGDPLQDVLESFMKDVGKAEYIVGHNVSFDIHVVGAELIRLGKKDTLTTKPSICTMQSTIDYCAIPGNCGRKYPKLQELHKKLFGYEFEGAHDALSDTRATLKCFVLLKQRGFYNRSPLCKKTLTEL